MLAEMIVWASSGASACSTVVGPFNWIGPGLDSIFESKEGSSRVVTQFLGQIVRGEPTIAMRLAPVSVRIPMPGVGNAGTIYELQKLVREKGFTNQ